jgi:uncharacterized Zn-finger protein
LYFSVNSTRTGRNVAPTAPLAWKLAIQRTSIQNNSATHRRMQISDIYNTVSTQSDTPKAPCCHKVKKPYKCDLCDKKFASEVNLKRHGCVHSEGKSHKCDICNEEFSVSAALRIHSLINLGMKTHKCDICLREFTRN